MSQKNDFNKLAFVLIAILSLFFIDKGHNLIELSLKLISIVFLFFYYLRKTKKINYWYIIVVVFSCLSSSLLVFDVKFLALGTLFMIFNRLLYIIISRRAVSKQNYKKLLMFILIFFVPIIIIFPQLKSNLKELTYPILLIGVLSAIMSSFAFVNYFNKMIVGNKYFVYGMLLFVLADLLTVYNQFINYNFYYVIVYTSLYFVARYFVCEAMILNKD